MKSFKEHYQEGWTPMRQIGITDSAKTHMVNGKPHSVNDLPSRIYFSGKKEYHQYGTLHRTNGPAVIYPNGDEEYYLNGEKHTKDEFDKKMQ